MLAATSSSSCSSPRRSKISTSAKIKQGVALSYRSVPWGQDFVLCLVRSVSWATGDHRPVALFVLDAFGQRTRSHCEQGSLPSVEQQLLWPRVTSVLFAKAKLLAAWLPVAWCQLGSPVWLVGFSKGLTLPHIALLFRLRLLQRRRVHEAMPKVHRFL